MFDPIRHGILKSVQRVREGVDPHRHAPFAQHVMRIPERDFYALAKLYPDLLSSDHQKNRDAWDRFEKSAFSEPYRVGKVARGVTKNGIILK